MKTKADILRLGKNPQYDLMPAYYRTPARRQMLLKLLLIYLEHPPREEFLRG